MSKFGRVKITGPVTRFGELLVGELHPQFQGSFEYTVSNTDLNTNTKTNGGTITQASAMALVGTSATTASTALLQSKQHARYKSGLGGVIRFTALFTTPVAVTEQYIGIADELGSSAAFKNGYMLGFDGLDFGFHRFQNDVKITIKQSAWDNPITSLTKTNLSIFYIRYGYLGASALEVFFESPTTGEVLLVHTEPYSSLFTEPSTHNPNFFFTMWVNNKGTTNDLVMKAGSYAYMVEGKTQFIELHQPQNSTGLQEATTVTTEVPIVTIRNRASYASKTNFIDIVLQEFSGSIEANAANNLGDIRIVRDGTLTDPSYSNINTNNSVVEVDTSATGISGGTELFSIPLAGKNDKFDKDVVNKKIILKPGGTITMTGASVNSATIRNAILWRELF